MTRNALEAGRRAGAKHHVALSVLGCDRLPDSGYMRAKVAQEQLIRAAQQPFTIVHSTQFMEFLPHLAHEAGDGDAVRVPDTDVQPVAAVEVAGLVASTATDAATNGVVEIAGPEVRDGALLPGPEARIATTRLADWLSRRYNEETANA